MNTLSVVHDFLRRTVKPGALCIDATAGRGRDTAIRSELLKEGYSNDEIANILKQLGS